MLQNGATVREEEDGEHTAPAECVHILGVDLCVELLSFPCGYVDLSDKDL